MLEKIWQKILKNDKKILVLLIFVYIVFFFLLSLKKYYNFDYNLLDLSIFNQVFFNTLHGNWFVDTVNIDIYLADHFAPIIFLLLPFYSLWQSAEFLLLLQSIVLGLAAWPLYLIAKSVSKDKAIALGIVLMWLFSPFVHTTNLLEFHLLPIAALFIFWTFYFYKQKKFNLFILFFILSLLVREDISFIMIAFAAFSFWDKRSLKWKLSTLLLPILYFALAYNIIAHFAPTGANKFLIYYSWLGGNTPLAIIFNWFKDPLQVFLHIFTWKNLLAIVVLLLPSLFLSLLRPKYLLLLLLPVLQILMTSKGLDFSSYSSHYVMLFSPAIFISVIFALHKIKNQEKFWASKTIYNNKGVAQIILGVTVVYFAIFLSPAKDVLFYQPNENLINIKKDFISIIEDKNRITAEASFLPHLSNRPVSYPLFYSYFAKNQFAARDFDMPEVDYILVDYSQFLGIVAEGHTTGYLQPYIEDIPKNWRRTLEDNYVLIKAKNNIYLWQNKSQASSEILPLYQTQSKSEVESDSMLLAWERSDNGLRLDLQKTDQEHDEFLIRFYQGDEYFDVPLDYGIFPMYEWSDSDLLRFYYYPDESVDSFQIFSWYGSNKLGLIKELVVDKILTEESEKITF
ncbi:hypothetical protein C0580_04350 [Candidatus Parcubacteria bacterium]|nr:MAG: hypothetical protein C0580_04350 [Candidatus Parcubacteria bacterium]